MLPMKRSLMGGVDISLPNVSYCEDVKDVHYTPYNLVRFYVVEITGTTPQTVKIYTDNGVFNEVQVSESNKWYSYVLPKDKGLYQIVGDSVKNVVLKANITTSGETIIPSSTIEAFFKGSNTSKVTNMYSMFKGCSNLTSLDVGSFDTSNVTDMGSMFANCSNLAELDLRNFNTSNVVYMQEMFYGCSSLTSLDLSGWNMSNVTSMRDIFDGCGSLETIRMVGCSQATIQKITNAKPSGATIITK